MKAQLSQVLLARKALMAYPGLLVILIFGYQLWMEAETIAFFPLVSDMVFTLLPVYVNLGLLLPYLLKQSRYGFYTLSAIGVIALAAFLPKLLPFASAMKQQPVIFNLTNALMLFLLATAYQYLIDYFKEQKRRRHLEYKQMETELQLLRMQLHPHFLFNTLNNLYGLAVTKSDRLPDLMLKLSDLLRYLHDEAKQTAVPLEKELAFLENYMELQKLRLPEHVSVQYHKNGDVENKTIAPALLINFLENSFKHLNTKDQGAFISVNIAIQSEEMFFDVVNSKKADTLNSESHSEREGSGLANIRKRLVWLYPDQHELTVKDEADQFQVTLNIRLV